MDNLRPGEALLSCMLAGMAALEDPDVRGTWSIATVMADALEQGRRARA